MLRIHRPFPPSQTAWEPRGLLTVDGARPRGGLVLPGLISLHLFHFLNGPPAGRPATNSLTNFKQELKIKLG